MTNKNRQRRWQKRKSKKQVQVSVKKEEAAKEKTVKEGTVAEGIVKEGEGKEGKNKMLDILSILVSGIALIISAFSFLNQYHYSELEYEYKIDPEIEVQGDMGMSIQLDEVGKYITLSDLENKIQIPQKNNLHSAYIIHSDYEIEKLEFNEEENTLETTEEINFSEPNMIVNGVSYHYEFLFLEGLDDGYKLYLLYMRSGRVENEFGFYKLSGVEILELEKAHINEEDYAGEKELAKKYLEVLEGCQKYMIQ